MNRPVLFLSIALFVLAVVVDQSAAGDDNDWEQYKKTFGKAYQNDSDESAHKTSFLNSQQQIAEHNAAFARGEHTFQLGINHLSDLTPAEYLARNGARQPKSANASSSASPFKPSMNLAVASVPASVDWRQQGYVTPVKDQGNCASCWAFSSTGALEGQNKRVTGNLVSLSEQNLVDCTTANWGCSGGWMDTAFAYVKSNPGLDTESSYPYMAKAGTCKFSKANNGVTVSGWTDIQSGSEAALQQAVATMGPVSVAIDASQPSFQNYRGGVYYEPKCSSSNVDHAVLVVGYGTDPTLGDYWLVKNSWGSTWWGESGYIRMARNKNNNCAIATYASVPTATAAGCTVSVNGQPETVPSGCIFCNGQQGVVTQYVTCNNGGFIATQCGSGTKCQGNGQCSIKCY